MLSGAVEASDSVREGKRVVQRPALLVRALTAEEDLVVPDLVLVAHVEVVGASGELRDVANGAAVRAIRRHYHLGEESETQSWVDRDGNWEGWTD